MNLHVDPNYVILNVISLGKKPAPSMYAHRLWARPEFIRDQRVDPAANGGHPYALPHSVPPILEVVRIANFRQQANQPPQGSDAHNCRQENAA